jgi:CRP/FNR family transcriptional regulator, transcriptional activator FtrB
VGTKLDLELMRRLPLLSGLDAHQLERLLSRAELRRHRKGKLLFEEGQSPNGLFMLLSGMVELFTSRGRRDAVVLILWPPEVFMPAPVLFDEPYLLSARTLSPATLIMFEAAAIREEVRGCPNLASRFTQILAGQFRMTVRHIKDLKLRSGPQRVGAFLLRLIDETGLSGCADLPIAKATLASRLGLTAESLSRTLPVLRDHGLTVRGSRIILTDRKRLERFCGPDPLIDGRELALSVTAI